MTAPDMACPESEVESLGACLLDPKRIPEVAPYLQWGAFTGWRKVVARAMWSLSDAAEPVDFVTVHAWLEANGLAAAAGSPDSLVRLGERVTSAGHVHHHARRVAAAASLRAMYARLRESAAELEQVGAGDREALRDAIDKLTEDMDALVRLAEPPERFSVRTTLANLRAELDGDTPRGLCTGILEVAQEVGALDNGSLGLIGGGPGVGKSLFVGQVKLNALRNGRRVLLWTGEMPASEVLLRSAANLSGVPFHVLRRGRLGMDDGAAYDLADSQLATYEGALEIIEDGPQPLATLRAAARRMRAAGGLDLVIVDHLGLLAEPRGDAGTRHAEVAETSRALKRLALELRIPVLCTVQLRRDYLDTEPGLSALAESFAPARDADLVLLAWLEGEDRSGVEFKVAKHRNGRAGHRFRLPIDFARMRAGSAASSARARQAGEGRWEV